MGIRQALDAADSTRQRLLSKQARGSQYRNKAERDKWIDGQISELSVSIATHKATRLDTHEEIRRLESSVQALEAEIAGLQEQIEGFGSNRGAINEQHSRAKETLQKLEDERRALRRETRSSSRNIPHHGRAQQRQVDTQPRHGSRHRPWARKHR